MIPAGHGSPATQPSVLLVDDNPAMRALIRSLVEEVTPVVHECESGRDAVAAYQAIRPDWVLMDIELSGLDGIAATRAILRLDPDARVIIVTAHGDNEYRQAADAAGARGFVLKEDLLALPALLSEPGEVPTDERTP